MKFLRLKALPNRQARLEAVCLGPTYLDSTLRSTSSQVRGGTVESKGD